MYTTYVKQDPGVSKTVWPVHDLYRHWNRIQELVRLSDQYTTYIDTETGSRS